MTQKGKLEELTFELTRKCPLRCIICSSNGGECFPREFDTDRVKAIIDDSVSMGVKRISLSGGEPLSRPDIVEICSFIKMRGLQLDLYTCGNSEKDGRIGPIPSELVTDLRHAGVDRMIFAIHGSSSEIHDRITARMKSYANLLRSISSAVEAGLRTELHFVPTRFNYQSLPKVMNTLRKLNGTRLSVLRFVPQGRGMANRGELELTLHEISQLKNLMSSLRKEHDESEFRIGAPFNSFHMGPPVPCTAGIDKATEHFYMKAVSYPR